MPLLEDIGKIIGRKGQTIQALRTILKRVGARLQKKILVELAQPENNSLTDEEVLSLDYISAASAEDFEEDSSLLKIASKKNLRSLYDLLQVYAQVVAALIIMISLIAQQRVSLVGAY